MTVVAVFGGSFDPPHVGHVLSATWVMATRAVDEIWVIPTFEHAFGKRLRPFSHRRRMVELAFAPIRGVRVVDLEARMAGPSYTVRTLEHLRREHPRHAWRLMIGTDLVDELPSWREGARIPTLAPPLVIGRGGHEDEEHEGHEEEVAVLMPDISSTEVRRRLRVGERVDHIVPRAVVLYIRQHGLYAGGEET